jgi:hypothetical protein
VATWTQHDPGVCNLAQLDAAISTLDGMIAKTSAVATNVSSNVEGVGPEDWTGSGADVWRTGGRATVRQVKDFHSSLVAVRTATAAYRAGVANIQLSAAPWLQDVMEANWVIHTPNMYPINPPQHVLDDIERDRTQALAKRATAYRMLGRLATQRELHDSAYISAIRYALPTNWENQRAALAAIGLDTVAELSNPVEVRRRMLEIASTIADSDLNDPCTAEIAALRAFYDLYGDDARFMSSFYLELGGAKTVLLVDAIGRKVGPGNPEFHSLANELGHQIRDGLSVGSASWTTSQADKFTVEMFGTIRETWSAIGYLFNDPLSSPLGEQLAISAAEYVDQLEREFHGSAFDGNPLPGGAALSWLDYGENDDGESLRVRDVHGPIFSTLGQYPDSAFDFLTDPEHGEGRIDYWFNSRDFFDYDRFQGVADLWLGAEQASAHDGLSDDAFEKRSAELTSYALSALTENEDFLPENVSNSATRALGGVFMQNIEAFTEYPISNSPDESDGGTAVERQLPNGVSYWSPSVTDVDMARFLGVAGGHPMGATVITQGIAEYQQLLLKVAINSGEPDRVAEALEQIVKLQGAVDGSQMGAVIAAAERSDERTEQMMDDIRDIVGIIPIKGASELIVDGGVFVLNMVQNYVVNGAIDAATNAWMRQGEFAIDAMYDGQAAREDMARFAIAANLYELYEGKLPGGTVGELPTLSIEDTDTDAQKQQKLAEYSASAQEWRSNPTNAAAVNAVLLELAGPTATLDGLADDYQSKYAAYSSYVRDQT